MLLYLGHVVLFGIFIHMCFVSRSSSPWCRSAKMTYERAPSRAARLSTCSEAAVSDLRRSASPPLSVDKGAVVLDDTACLRSRLTAEAVWF